MSPCGSREPALDWAEFSYRCSRVKFLRIAYEAGESPKLVEELEVKYGFRDTPAQTTRLQVESEETLGKRRPQVAYGSHQYRLLVTGESF